MISKIALQGALHKATSASNEIIRHLQASNHQDASTLNDGLTTTLSVGPQAISGSLEKLAEAATQLLQIATDPREYLGHLAANVRVIPHFNTDHQVSFISLVTKRSFSIASKSSMSSLACQFKNTRPHPSLRNDQLFAAGLAGQGSRISAQRRRSNGHCPQFPLGT